MSAYQRRRVEQALAAAESEADAWETTVRRHADEAGMMRLAVAEAEATEHTARVQLGEAQRHEPLSFTGDWEPTRGPLNVYQRYLSATAAADDARQALALAEAPLTVATRQRDLWAGERDRLRAELETRTTADEAPPAAPEPFLDVYEVEPALPVAPTLRDRLSDVATRWRFGGSGQ